MRKAGILVAASLLLALFTGTGALAQSVSPVSVDSAIGVDQFAGQNAAGRPEVIVDVAATVRLGDGWVAYIRPWFRKAPNSPYTLASEIYQAALQHQRAGRVSTRVDLGYILSPIGLGMLDTRPDTNPTITSHMSYFIPMPTFDPGAPSSMPIASSYPLGGQLTASATRWDARAAVVTAPPNRSYVIHSLSANPSLRPMVVVGGGVTPRTGLRLGVAYADGRYAEASELTGTATGDRRLRMVSLEAEFAVGYTRFTGEFTRDSIDRAVGHAEASEWFAQGVQALSPRWFVAGRLEGADAPPRTATAATPTLRVSDLTLGYRVSPELTLRGAYVRRKTYFSQTTDDQAGLSIVWARRWW